MPVPAICVSNTPSEVQQLAHSAVQLPPLVTGSITTSPVPSQKLWSSIPASGTLPISTSTVVVCTQGFSDVYVILTAPGDAFEGDNWPFADRQSVQVPAQLPLYKSSVVSSTAAASLHTNSGAVTSTGSGELRLT